MKISKIIGYSLIVAGITLNINKLIIKRSTEITEKNRVEYTLEKEISYKEKDETYDAILEIPLINLKKGIYKKEDKRNNIEENIMIHDSSIYPDIDNSNIILIAHSGTGEKAFFKDLYKLNNDSLIKFYYHHTKYIYKIDKYYLVDKAGDIEIERDRNKKTITLITCDSKDKSKQTVYIGYLIEEIKY